MPIEYNSDVIPVSILQGEHDKNEKENKGKDCVLDSRSNIYTRTNDMIYNVYCADGEINLFLKIEFWMRFLISSLLHAYSIKYKYFTYHPSPGQFTC